MNVRRQEKKNQINNLLLNPIDIREVMAAVKKNKDRIKTADKYDESLWTNLSVPFRDVTNV